MCTYVDFTAACASVVIGIFFYKHGLNAQAACTTLLPRTARCAHVTGKSRSASTAHRRALPSSLQREGLEQLRGYESESERRYMVEYEYAMYAPYHPDLTDVASF